MFGFVERFITSKILETTRDHWLGDQAALEALIRFSDEELKHQELFRRIEAMMDELEWPREDSKLTAEERDRAIDELIALVVDVDGILQNQSKADVAYFLDLCNRSFTDDEVRRIQDGTLRAYRWQYIFSGVEHPRFQKLYQELTNEDQRNRVSAALATLA
jgi:hypothetical protein